MNIKAVNLMVGLFAFSSVTSAYAALPDYVLEKIAFRGEPAPTGGSLALIFGESWIDDDGRILTSANAGISTQLHILWDDVSLSAALTGGDALPTPPGGVVVAPANGRVAAPDIYAFTAAYGGPPALFGAFLREGPVETAVLLPGDPAPGGGTVTRINSVHDVNESGIASWGGLVDPGDATSLAAHFVGRPGAISEVYREGGATPIGGVWSDVSVFDKSSVQADGSVVFMSSVVGGSAAGGLFRWQAGTVTSLLLDGSAVPDGSGDQFDPSVSKKVGSNEVGDFAFNARVIRAGAAFPTESVYRLFAGQIEAVIHTDDVIPGTDPVLTFQGLLGSTPPDISADGTVVFTAILYDSSDVFFPALLVSEGGATKVLALGGDPVPAVPGAVFGDFSFARINSSGLVAVTASTDQGVGVFLATPIPPAVPMLRGAGASLVVFAMAIVGIIGMRGTRGEVQASVEIQG